MPKKTKKSSRKKTLSRRDFIKKSAQLGFNTLLFSAGCSTLSQTQSNRGIAAESQIYDYIVVGSGAGGGPLACRLAEAGFTVALIEAGSDYKSDLNPALDKYSVPVFHPLSTEEPGLCWNFWVNHYESQARRLRDRTNYNRERKGVLYPRAGTLGGCTAHNAMFTLYPDNEDWDAIYELSRQSGKPDPTWQSSEMLKYFKKIEKCQYIPKPFIDTPLEESWEPLHGWEGWLPTELSNIGFAIGDPQIRNIVLGAATAHADDGVFATLKRAFDDRAFTYARDLDPNNSHYVKNKKDGLFVIPKATSGGKRRGTREFIKNTMDARPDHLVLKKNHLVTELLFDSTERNKVIGVYCYHYKADRPLYSADPRASASHFSQAVGVAIKARKEVILAGGAFNTPQLLMLSGIGDTNVLDPILSSVGKRSRVHLPGVGKNLQDRYEVGVVTQIDNDFSLLKGCKPGDAQDPCLKKYESLVGPRNQNTGEESGNAQSSPYSTNGALVAFIKRSTPDKSSPDLCIFGVPGKFEGYHTGYAKEAYTKNIFTWTILKGHTQNTAGEVTLRSASPFETPNISFKYFDEGNAPNSDDAQCVVDAVKYVRSINNSGPIKSIRQNPASQELVPGVDIESDVEITQWVKDHAWGHHASCSNKMGNIETDPNAVVDTNFKVHRVQRLRIVDASVFPRVPGLYIVTPIYMISEKAADVIIADDKNTAPNFI